MQPPPPARNPLASRRAFTYTSRARAVAYVHSLSAQARTEAQRACRGDVGTNHEHESFLASR
eukprot:scaffold54966_cov60-Phaeocystis_antarctica.AAC.3